MGHKQSKKRSWKEHKRQVKLQQKQDKQQRKRARKEDKLARKLIRQQQRKVVTLRSLLNRPDAMQRIEELLAGVKAGRVSLDHGDGELQIVPGEIVALRVKAQRTHKSESLTIQVRWPRPNKSA